MNFVLFPLGDEMLATLFCWNITPEQIDAAVSDIMCYFHMLSFFNVKEDDMTSKRCLFMIYHLSSFISECFDILIWIYEVLHLNFC